MADPKEKGGMRGLRPARSELTEAQLEQIRMMQAGPGDTSGWVILMDENLPSAEGTSPLFAASEGLLTGSVLSSTAGGRGGGGSGEMPRAAAAVPDPESADNAKMADTVSRSELDAKLDALRQEMRADSAALRGDFATMSASINQSVATMAVSVADLKGNLQGGLGEIRGSVDGLKTSITMLQWVIGLVAALGGIWVAYAQLRQAEVQPPPQPSPIIINVPPAGQIQVPPAAVPQQKSQGDKGNG